MRQNMDTNAAQQGSRGSNRTTFNMGFQVEMLSWWNAMQI